MAEHRRAAGPSDVAGWARPEPHRSWTSPDGNGPLCFTVMSPRGTGSAPPVIEPRSTGQRRGARRFEDPLHHHRAVGLRSSHEPLDISIHGPAGVAWCLPTGARPRPGARRRRGGDRSPPPRCGPSWTPDSSLVALTLTPRIARPPAWSGRPSPPGSAPPRPGDPDAREKATPLYVLLDDLPSPWSDLRLLPALQRRHRHRHRRGLDSRGHVCAGWRSGRHHDGVHLTHTPGCPFPSAHRPTGSSGRRPLAWHDIGRRSPPPGRIPRRRRLVEVTDSDPGLVYAMSPGAHVGPEKTQNRVDEYLGHGEARPHHPDPLRLRPTGPAMVKCPESRTERGAPRRATASELRRYRLAPAAGLTTCRTHLNDLLRSPATSALAALLPEA